MTALASTAFPRKVAELADRLALRDSKDPVGPVLAFPQAEWRAFLSSARTGQ
ncbi:MAG: DUF397 domain-containing protein, partial [Actinobacteria bacterium]|nr:DUF397 domain-containing protein [Actinomycetota bacterium]